VPRRSDVEGADGGTAPRSEELPEMMKRIAPLEHRDSTGRFAATRPSAASWESRSAPRSRRP
jgi:hypothetical protein